MCYILVDASIGSSVTLTCTISGTQLYWYGMGKNGLRTLIDDPKYEGTRTNFLKITSLTTYTSGVYYCQSIDGIKGPDITISILGECVVYINTNPNVLSVVCYISMMFLCLIRVAKSSLFTNCYLHYNFDTFYFLEYM